MPHLHLAIMIPVGMGSTPFDLQFLHSAMPEIMQRAAMLRAVFGSLPGFFFGSKYSNAAPSRFRHHPQAGKASE